MVTALKLAPRKQLSFEDLRGLRAEGYVRDSTLDQKDGFGPEIQRHNIQRFAESYSLALGARWYTEFISGRSAGKRSEFQQFLADARVDAYDVLLVDHTSRFGRNQEECIRFKSELQRLGKSVVFVSQGIISGSDRDFLSERINETLDEQYSRNLSRYVSAGLAEKAAHGLHVGPAPFGYKSELLSGRRERKAPNSETMPGLLLALRLYAAGRHSYREVADQLNAQGFRMPSGHPLTGYSIRDILANRFYEGNVVYHEGLPDEQVIAGAHEVPSDVKELWLRCQEVKRGRTLITAGRPRTEHRTYPFARVLKCQRCGSPYHGEAVRYKGKERLGLRHEHRGQGRQCGAWPRSQSAEALARQFGERVLRFVALNDGWQQLVLSALKNERQEEDTTEQRERLQRALENLRKQHLWGDIADEHYRRERTALERQLKIATPAPHPAALPNLERAAQLLNSLPALWSHSGVTNEQREELASEVFSKVTIDGRVLTAIEPKPAYVPLFAAMMVQLNRVGNRDVEPPPSPPRTQLLRHLRQPFDPFANAQDLDAGGQDEGCLTTVGARFPYQRTLDQFDFSAAPWLKKGKLLELAKGEYIAQKENVVLIGNMGTGKTHTAIALGLLACRQGKRVRFVTATGLINDLVEAQEQHTLGKRLAQLQKLDLLIVDEVGFVPFTPDGARLLFQVCTDRYLRGSLIITTNLEFGRWGEVFGDERLTGALLDRLTHRCHVLEFNGDSYRFRESLRRQEATV